ncbi:MAG: hypothetical protein AB1473_15325 [Thermodesulfobacteriota bacterium]
MARKHTLGNTSLLLLILLIVVTLGFYIPIWYIRVRSTLAELKTTSRMPRYLPHGFLFLYVVEALVLADTESRTFAKPGWENVVYSFLVMVSLLSHAFLAARVVDILDEYSRGGLTSRRSVSWLRACVLPVIYLQYEMNRLPAPVDGICPFREENAEADGQVWSRTETERSRG